MCLREEELHATPGSRGAVMVVVVLRQVHLLHTEQNLISSSFQVFEYSVREEQLHAVLDGLNSAGARLFSLNLRSFSSADVSVSTHVFSPRQ